MCRSSLSPTSTLSSNHFRRWIDSKRCRKNPKLIDMSPLCMVSFYTRRLHQTLCWGRGDMISCLEWDLGFIREDTSADIGVCCLLIIKYTFMKFDGTMSHSWGKAEGVTSIYFGAVISSIRDAIKYYALTNIKVRFASEQLEHLWQLLAFSVTHRIQLDIGRGEMHGPSVGYSNTAPSSIFFISYFSLSSHFVSGICEWKRS